MQQSCYNALTRFLRACKYTYSETIHTREKHGRCAKPVVTDRQLSTWKMLQQNFRSLFTSTFFDPVCRNANAIPNDGTLYLKLNHTSQIFPISLRIGFFRILFFFFSLFKIESLQNWFVVRGMHSNTAPLKVKSLARTRAVTKLSKV